MKKLFGLIIILALVTVTFASAEVVPTLDVDVGIELMSSPDSVTFELATVENDFVFGQDYSFTSTAILHTEYLVSTKHYVSAHSTKDDAIHRQSRYSYMYIDAIYNPPLEITLYLSSFRLVDKQVSPRA